MALEGLTASEHAVLVQLPPHMPWLLFVQLPVELRAEAPERRLEADQAPVVASGAAVLDFSVLRSELVA